MSELKLINHHSEILCIQISGYKVKNSVDHLYDSDWLMATVRIEQAQNSFTLDLSLLVIEELLRLMYWIKLDQLNQTFEFIDAGIRIRKIKRGGKRMDKWIIENSERNKIQFDVVMDDQMINGMMQQLGNMLSSFPCRCHHPHQITNSVVYKDYPSWSELRLKPREFGSAYQNEEEYIAGNLYSWLHETFRILWDISEKDNTIIIYLKSCHRLGRRFGTLLKMDQHVSEKIMEQLVVNLADCELEWMLKNNVIKMTRQQQEMYLLSGAAQLNLPDEQKSMLIKLMDMFVKNKNLKTYEK